MYDRGGIALGHHMLVTTPQVQPEMGLLSPQQQKGMVRVAGQHKGGACSEAPQALKG
jgi:hypothetical protein